MIVSRSAFFLFATASLVGCRPSTSAPGPTLVSTQASVSAQAKESSHVPSRSYDKPPESDLKQKLSPMQFQVTQHDATEPPFHNEYWDNHAPGIYVDVATGEPLFSSVDKFESGTGWPSFI